MGRCVVLAAAALLSAAWSVTACSTQPVATPCHSNVVVGPVPEWANAGFTPGAEVPHVVGQNGTIVAVYFAASLVAAQGPDPVNKVLFVARKPLPSLTPLSIDAQLDGAGEVVHRERAEGPGPGMLDLPRPGCWRLTLTWADQKDTLDLEYVAQPGT